MRWTVILATNFAFRSENKPCKGTVVRGMCLFAKTDTTTPLRQLSSGSASLRRAYVPTDKLPRLRLLARRTQGNTKAAVGEAE